MLFFIYERGYSAVVCYKDVDKLRQRQLLPVVRFEFWIFVKRSRCCCHKIPKSPSFISTDTILPIWIKHIIDEVVNAIRHLIFSG